MILVAHAWAEDWLLYHRVVFDGINRVIVITPGTTSLDIKTEVYSAWKEWVMLRDNAKFAPALRTTGGDPIGSAGATGDVYFTINGWRILLTGTCSVTGTIFSDDYPSPFITQSGVQLVTNQVSSLVQSLGFNGTLSPIVEPNIMPADVWDYLMADANTPGSVGAQLHKLLTVAKFLGLK